MMHHEDYGFMGVHVGWWIFIVVLVVVVIVFLSRARGKR